MDRILPKGHLQQFPWNPLEYFRGNFNTDGEICKLYRQVSAPGGYLNQFRFETLSAYFIELRTFSLMK